ncbi:MAG: acetate kinase, partial [Bacilli bacterium]
MSKIMTINSGSSSLKFKLYEMPEEKVICSGNCERIGLKDGIFTIRFDGKKEQTFPAFPNHAVAARTVLEALLSKGIIKDFSDIKAMGHRVVQGGKYFSKSALFTDETEKKIDSLIPL